MRLNKKAQFFLIAALILSAIVLSFGKIYNSSSIQRIDTQVEGFSEEIQYEASRVVDNGLLQGDSRQVEANLIKLTEYYGDRSPDSDIDIIFGDKDSLQTISYDSELGTTNKKSISKSGNAKIFKSRDSINVKITLQDETKQRRNSANAPGITGETPGQERKEARVINRKFDLKEKQNFYVVVKKKVDNDQVTIIR